MTRIAKVSSKGQIVIPAEIRKNLGYPNAMLVQEDGNRVILVPAQTLKEAFGADGDASARVAAEISRERRREVESERS
jgi:AbrB family looped-hinge helix DNA binding protein